MRPLGPEGPGEFGAGPRLALGPDPRAQAKSAVGEPSCLEAGSRWAAASYDLACSRRLRTSSSRAALSAFSWGRGGSRSQGGQPLSWGGPAIPRQAPAHPVTFCRSSCSFLSMDSR